jgi:superfamily II DNA or RNA helicase
MSERQNLTKNFNSNDTEIYLISTAAGGLGLNLPSANRVIIFDFKFNPIMEEQAIGRAYRIGQKKPVFVYRFVMGGTFETNIHNKTVFKTQLASRVVDKKNPMAWATKNSSEFLFEPKHVEQNDLSEFQGMDPNVLDIILASQSTESIIRDIVQSESFERDDEDKLTSEEQREVDQWISDDQLLRTNPKAFHELMAKRQAQSSTHRIVPSMPVGSIAPWSGTPSRIPMHHAATTPILPGMQSGLSDPTR